MACDVHNSEVQFFITYFEILHIHDGMMDSRGKDRYIIK